MISRIIFVLVGGGMLIWAYAMYSQQVRFIEHSKKTSAVVVENYVDPHEGGYFPVVEFKTPEGKTFTFRGHVGSDLPKFQIGQQVEVLYDPTKPENAQIDTSHDKWLAIEIIGSVGMVFSVLGALAFTSKFKMID